MSSMRRCVSRSDCRSRPLLTTVGESDSHCSTMPLAEAIATLSEGLHTDSALLLLWPTRVWSSSKTRSYGGLQLRPLARGAELPGGETVR